MKTKYAVALVALVFLVVGMVPAFAQFDDAGKVSKHLKKLDYEVEKGDESVSATHESELNLSVREYKDGLLIRAWLETSDESVKTLRKLCNTLNYNATVARMYIDDEDDLIFEAWYPGEYDKDKFDTFMEAWQNDTSGQYSRIKDALDL